MPTSRRIIRLQQSPAPDTHGDDGAETSKDAAHTGARALSHDKGEALLSPQGVQMERRSGASAPARAADRAPTPAAMIAMALELSQRARECRLATFGFPAEGDIGDVAFALDATGPTLGRALPLVERAARGHSEGPRSDDYMNAEALLTNSFGELDAAVQTVSATLVGRPSPQAPTQAEITAMRAALAALHAAFDPNARVVSVSLLRTMAGSLQRLDALVLEWQAHASDANARLVGP